MEDWHLIKTLPEFCANNKTVYVEIMLRNGMRDCAYFGKDKNGTVYCDTGYCLVDIQEIVKWRPIELF